jgi:phosphotransacetylase
MTESNTSCHKEPDEIPFYRELIKGIGKDIDPLRTAVIHPVDRNSLAGALEAANMGLLYPVLIGPEERIRKVADELEVDLSDFELVSAEHSHEAAEKGVTMAADGEVGGLMKGHIHTDELLHAVMDKGKRLLTGRRISHVFIIDVPHENYPKPIFLSDAAVNIQPTLAHKKDITQNAIDLFRACRDGIPKVAILSATEQVTEDILSTIHAAAISKMAERGVITGGIVDGPLAFDNAISKEAAESKNIRSEVAGDADILIVPDIDSGNMLYKQMKYLSGYNAAGLVVGARVPIMLTSRAGDVEARVASAALALRYVRSREGQSIL